MDQTLSPQSPVEPAALPAAEYVRMSTEHQQYSTENQRDVIQDYAQKRGMTIVRTYTDAGKSGLRIEGRDALKQLIHDVEAGQADFSAILVYDVSRWGRFQNADESAYYEYIVSVKQGTSGVCRSVLASWRNETSRWQARSSHVH